MPYVFVVVTAIAGALIVGAIINKQVPRDKVLRAQGCGYVNNSLRIDPTQSNPTPVEVELWACPKQ